MTAFAYVTRLYRDAVRLSKYTRRFGVYAGTRNFLSGFGTRSTAVLYDPSRNCRLVLRPGTSDVPTFDQVFIAEEYGFSFGDLKPRLIIDAGANVGFATLYLARRFPDAQIIALEPEDRNFDLLLANTRALPNVKAIKAALWPRECGLRIVNLGSEPWAFRVEEVETPDAPIQGTTVEALLALAGAQEVDLLKIDIEGAETEVFGEGCHRWLGGVSAIVIELHDWFRPGCAAAFYRAVSQYAFVQYQRGENTLVLKEPTRVPRRSLGVQ